MWLSKLTPGCTIYTTSGGRLYLFWSSSETTLNLESILSLPALHLFSIPSESSLDEVNVKDEYLWCYFLLIFLLQDRPCFFDCFCRLSLRNFFDLWYLISTSASTLASRSSGSDKDNKRMGDFALLRHSLGSMKAAFDSLRFYEITSLVTLMKMSVFPCTWNIEFCLFFKQIV